MFAFVLGRVFQAIPVMLAVAFISFAIFMGLKAINTLKRKQEEAAAPAGPTKDQELLTEIRDLLKSQQGK